MIHNSIKNWNQIKSHLKAPNMYRDTPICDNHAFKPSAGDPVFARWREKGVGFLSDLYQGGHLMSFEQLKTKYNLPVSPVRYLQIRNFIKTHVSTLAGIPQHTALERIMKILPGKKGAVSSLYQTIFSQIETNTEKQRSEWESELGVPLSIEYWETCLSNIHRCSINVRHKLIQFKIIHRLHYSKLKVNKMYPNVSALCNKCRNQVGTLTHQLWTCPSLHSFWSSIVDFHSKGI